MFRRLKSVGFAIALPGLLWAPGSLILKAPAIAQVQASPLRHTEADQRLQQGTRAYETADYDAALKWLQQALELYQSDASEAALSQQGQVQALSVLSEIHAELQNSEQAVELGQQAVALAKAGKSRFLEGRALVAFGRALLQAGQDQQAQQVAEESLKITRETGDRQGEGQALINLSGIYIFALKQPKTALELAQKAVSIAREIGDRCTEGRAFWRVGQALEEQNQLTQAIAAYEQGLEAAKAAGDRRNMGLLLLNIGWSYNILEAHDKAVPYLQQGVELTEALPLLLLRFQTIYQLGSAYLELKQHQQAIQVYQRAIAVAQEANNLKQQYNAWSDLAATYARASDPANSVKAREEAFKVAQQLQDPKILADAHRLLGSALGSSGNHQEAVPHYYQAIQLYRQLSDSPAEVKTLVVLIEARMELKDYPKAIELSQQGIQLAKSLSDLSSEYSLWSNLAAIYSRAGDRDNSFKAREEALKVAQQLKDSKILAEAYQKLGSVSGISSDYQAGDYQTAVKYFQQAIELYRQERDLRGETSTLILMAESFNNLKEYGKAVEIGQQALKMANSLPDASKTTASALEVLSASYINLGDQYGKDEQYAKALEIFQQVQELGKQYNRGDLQAKALNYIGWNYRRQQNYDKAIAVLQQGLTLAQKTESHVQEMDILLDLRTVYYLHREYEKALDSTEQAWRVVQAQINRSDNEDERLKWLRREGRSVLPRLVFVHQILKNYPKAIEVAQLTLKNAQERNDFGDIANASYNLLSTYSNAQQYSEGITFAQSFLEQAEQRGDKKFIAQAQALLGDAYYKAKDYPNAIATYKQSLAIAQEVEDSDRQIRILNVLSETYINTGEFDKTIALAQQALELIPKTKNSELEILILANLGRAYQGLEDYPKAIEQLQAGLAIAEQQNNLHQQARLWMLLGLVHNSTKDFSKLLEAFNRAQAIAEKDANALFSSVSQVLQSAACLQLGSINCGKEEVQQAPEGELASRGDIELLTILQLFVESFTTFTRGNYSQSLAIAQRMLPLAQNQKNPNSISYVYQLMAINHAELGNPQQAVSYAEDGVEIAKTTKDKSLHSSAFNALGEVYRKFGQTDKAIEAYQAAIAAKSEDAAGAYTGLGRIYRETQPSLAITFYKQAVSQIEAVRQKNRALPSDLQASFLQAAQGLGQTKVADTYRELADLLLKSDRILEAQQVLDLLKVKELDDYLRNVRGTGEQLVILRPEEEILQKYNELQKNAIQLGQEFTQLQAKIFAGKELNAQENERLTQLHQLQKELVEQFKQFAQRPDIAQLLQQLSYVATADTVKPETFNSLRNDLKQLNAVLLYPLVLEDRLELIITTPDAPPLRRTVNVKREDLNRVIAEFRLALGNRDRNIQASAQQLYTWLIKPIENDLKQANPQTILYAPDAQLRYIPLAALHDGQQWLVQRYATNNITLQSLTEYRSQPPSQPRILAGAFADTAIEYPVSVGDRTLNFSGLPFAGKEVANLVESIPKTTSFFDKDFSLSALEPRMNAYNILHFATHAAFVPEQPEESFILFGDGKPASIRSIGSWTLTNVNLVVLSACETGIGVRATGNDLTQSNGIEILGLGYQFQKAGAKAAIASLWRVDDGGTQALMVAFYEALQSGKTKAEALRQAQLALIQSNSQIASDQRSDIMVRWQAGVNPKVIDTLNHPYYWAPFILIGNGL